MTTAELTAIEQSAFARLEQEKRLLNPVYKGEINSKGRFGFRGEVALKFAASIADEARPPETMAQQVISGAEPGSDKIDFFACYLLSFGYIEDLVPVLKENLSPTGKYFLFCNNIDLRKRYQVVVDGIPFHILPIDEATVYNELLELLYLERGDLKKLDTAAKIDRIMDTALTFDGKFPEISLAECLATMGPVRNPNENRPV
ncbi:hypothetical protein A9404_01570 [Halothiobacillus diazotrophicus]|uniref:Uncharacterized protein n=1 Tax=Halothiobacillus diazotrophicus TaxID=1860122 RepID=A0A191ZED5_9GAMM|nr:hypothetical protein [Halothiobacillus diazotrophicus]ANJ66236.1 hypothetical protein A9404_01570 [Halothiobacillus diazotrophicus]